MSRESIRVEIEIFHEGSVKCVESKDDKCHYLFYGTNLF